MIYLNPLDRQIMELKGWTPDPFSDGNDFADVWGPPDGSGLYIVGYPDDPIWSNDDAKALRTG